VLIAVYRGRLHLTGLPGPVADHARSSLALATRLGPPVADQAQQAFVDGMSSALLCAAAVVAAAAFAVAVLLRPHRRADTAMPAAMPAGAASVHTPGQPALAGRGPPGPRTHQNKTVDQRPGSWPVRT
jgi:hypothetical protein